MDVEVLEEEVDLESDRDPEPLVVVDLVWLVVEASAEEVAEVVVTADVLSEAVEDASSGTATVAAAAVFNSTVFPI